jgi:hypothetical protein
MMRLIQEGWHPTPTDDDRAVMDGAPGVFCAGAGKHDLAAATAKARTTAETAKSLRYVPEREVVSNQGDDLVFFGEFVRNT